MKERIVVEITVESHPAAPVDVKLIPILNAVLDQMYGVSEYKVSSERI